MVQQQRRLSEETLATIEEGLAPVHELIEKVENRVTKGIQAALHDVQGLSEGQVELSQSTERGHLITGRRPDLLRHVRDTYTDLGDLGLTGENAIRNGRAEMPEMHPRPQLARRARPLRPRLCLARFHSPKWGRSPRLPAPSPSNADDTYNTIDGLYYQGIDEGVYNTIHQKNADVLYYQETNEAKPSKTATAPDTQLLLLQQQQQQQQQLRQCNSARRTTTRAGPLGPQDEEFEQEAWSSILDYVPGILNQQKPPRKNESPGEQAERAQKTTVAEPATGQPPDAQPPPPEAPEVTNTTAPTRGVLRGLSPLAAGAARAIPQATHVPVKHGDGVYYQKAAPPGSEHEAKGTHDSLEPTKMTLDTHNNYDDYLPALEPAIDVFEDAYPTGAGLESTRGMTTIQPTMTYRNRPAAHGAPDDRRNQMAHRHQGLRATTEAKRLRPKKRLALSATAVQEQNGVNGDANNDAWDLRRATFTRAARSSGRGDGPLSLLAVPSRSTDLVLEKGEQAELRFFIAKHPWEVGRLLSDARKLYPETKTGDNEKGDIEANYKAKRKGGAKRKREDADA
ncbi:unnamed protein product, partial [Symbiodinium sp. KB8]